MKLNILFVSAILCCSSSFSQTITRSSIGTIGNTHSGSGITVQQSVGQPYQTQSYYSNEIESRPGFIQPSRMAIEFVNSTFEVEITLYPNPAVNEVQFESNEDLENTTVQVMDLTGKILHSEDVQRLSEYSLDCTEWPNGQYVILISDNQSHVHKSKLIKQ